MGEVNGVRSTGKLVLLRFKDDAQLYDLQGRARLSSSMRAELKGLDTVWLTADEDNPDHKASRPLAIFSSRVPTQDQNSRSRYQVQLHALTPTGRWVLLPDASYAEVYWRAAEGPQKLGEPVLLRTTAGMGILDAEGGWRLKPERNRDFYAVAGGWVGIRGRGDEPDQLWNAQGQKVVLRGNFRSYEVAAGLAWLENDGRWQMLDSRKASLQTLDDVKDAKLVSSAGGQVVMSREGNGQEGSHLLALYSAQGKRLSPWLRLDSLSPILDAGHVLHGWVGVRSQEDAGSFSMLLSRDGKPLTQLLPMSIRPIEGQSLLVFGSGRSKGVMTAQGKVLVPAFYGYVSDAKHQWIKTDEGKWDGLLDAQSHWLALLPASRQFEGLTGKNIAVLGSSYDVEGAVDINGRVLQRVQAPAQPSDIHALPPRRWLVTASPLPLKDQFAVDDEQPAHWLVEGMGGGQQDNVARDMQGRQRFKADKDQSLQMLNTTMVLYTEQGNAELLGASGEKLAVFDKSKLLANQQERLMLTNMQPLPADHPLARAERQDQLEGDWPSDAATAKSRDKSTDLGNAQAQALQLSLVNERDGRILGGHFDAMGELSESRAAVSHMGNLAVIDAQGQLLVQSAWRCGVAPVLLDATGEITWPVELRGQARLECSKH